MKQRAGSSSLPFLRNDALPPAAAPMQWQLLQCCANFCIPFRNAPSDGDIGSVSPAPTG